MPKTNVSLACVRFVAANAAAVATNATAASASVSRSVLPIVLLSKGPTTLN